MKYEIKINVEKSNLYSGDVVKHPALFETVNNLVEAMVYDSDYTINDFLNEEIENQIKSLGINECSKIFTDIEFQELVYQATEAYSSLNCEYNALEIFYYSKVCELLQKICKEVIIQFALRTMIEIETDNPLIATIVQAHLSAFCTWLASFIKIDDSMQIDTVRSSFYLYLKSEIEKLNVLYNFTYKILKI